jgi:hypothetical protein
MVLKGIEAENGTGIKIGFNSKLNIGGNSGFNVIRIRN